ncbi:MAG TPA: AAA family ATPase [Ruminococcaceae bacterium]|nr:AAA family ATPase [Oscillospiraceae bacterium]
MITLKKATIYKYKCIENEQSFNVEDGITVLVGMNESGKTSILEAMAKCNYFEESDSDFAFDTTHDYPRKQKKAMDKSGVIPDAVKLTYVIDKELKAKIETDIGVKISSCDFSVTRNYNNKSSWSINWTTVDSFVKARTKSVSNKTLIKQLQEVHNKSEFSALINSISDDEESDDLSILKSLESYFKNEYGCGNPVDEYIVRTYLKPNLPKFMYYDDYYMLPSRVSLDGISSSSTNSSADKTAKALLELADIDIDKVVNATDYEDFIAELEATQLIITDELFKYWTTNKNLKILFGIDKVEKTDPRNGARIVDHVLDIRVQNQRSGVSLPLANRSKGFNWFFSFLVWFMKIQENRNDTYILLLDEPGLNLHAKAQNDLLRFLSDLADNYQIIYTTHSPFMIETEHLNQVRTVLEKDDGTHISECLQEKDPNTLFPLQAALGYTIAQNLFVSEKNLIVEGIADLVYLNLLSTKLNDLGRTSLKSSVTIVPVGGADKVATFVSLLRGNDLNMLCLLDTFTDQSAKARLDNLIAQNIIKDKRILFYHSVINTDFADVEDLFSDSDYLTLFNGAFSKDIKQSDIDANKPIMKQLKEKNGNKDFNHYSPANYFAKNIANITLSDETLDNFEALFKAINKLF